MFVSEYLGGVMFDNSTSIGNYISLTFLWYTLELKLAHFQGNKVGEDWAFVCLELGFCYQSKHCYKNYRKRVKNKNPNFRTSESIKDLVVYLKNVILLFTASLLLYNIRLMLFFCFSYRISHSSGPCGPDIIILVEILLLAKINTSDIIWCFNIFIFYNSYDLML